MVAVDIDSTSVEDYDITSKAIPLRSVNRIVWYSQQMVT